MSIRHPLLERLDTLGATEATKPIQVSTLAAGKASGQPYAVDCGTAAQRCKIARADGSYEDA